MYANFTCGGNKLTSLEYSPKYIGGGAFFNSNKLISLKGYCAKAILYTIGNPLPGKVASFMDFIPDQQQLIKNQEEYGIWFNDGSFNERRFDILMEHLGQE